MKICSICHESKPLEDFGKGTRTADGLCPWCRACRSAYDKQRYNADPEKARKRVQDYRVENKEAINEHKRELYADNREQRKAYTRDYYAQNKEKAQKYARDWYAANREKASTAARLRYQADPVKGMEQQKAARLKDIHTRRMKERLKSAKRRGLMAEVEVEKVNPIDIFNRDGWICHLCKLPVSEEEASIDHLIPLAHNGPHIASNLATAHRRCNSARGARPLEVTQ